MLTFVTDGTYKATGALYFTTSSVGKYHAQGASPVGKAIGLNATKSNALYGRSSSVTPLSCKCKFAIRF